MRPAGRCRGRVGVAEPVVEQEAVARLATARLVPGDQNEAGVVVDALFASSGIEAEIVSEAEILEIGLGLRVPVAAIGHLIALKLLSRNDETRPLDRADLAALVGAAEPADIEQARAAVALIRRRGFQRDKDLAAELAQLLRECGPRLRLEEIQSRIWSCTRCEGDSKVALNIRQQTRSLPATTRLLIVATAPPHKRGVTTKIEAASVHNDPEDRLRAFLQETLAAGWNQLVARGVAVLHSVKCAIVPKDREEDERQHQNPPNRVVSRCVPPHFSQELRALNAPVVVTLGTAALLAVRKTCGSAAPPFLRLPLGEFSQGDVFRLRLEDVEFDLIVSVHFSADRGRAARDIRRAALSAGVIDDSTT
jgi:hypothetical protein